MVIALFLFSTYSTTFRVLDAVIRLQINLENSDWFVADQIFLIINSVRLFYVFIYLLLRTFREFKLCMHLVYNSKCKQQQIQTVRSFVFLSDIVKILLCALFLNISFHFFPSIYTYKADVKHAFQIIMILNIYFDWLNIIIQSIGLLYWLV